MLFWIFIIIPLVEIAGFIVIGDALGFWLTLLTVIITAMIGSNLLRRQGMDTLHRMQRVVNDGGVPLDELLDAVCLLVAGVLLITPGFFTDAFGFLLFVPSFRNFAKELFVSAQFMTIVNFTQTRNTSRHAQSHGRAHDESGDIVDADYEVIDDEK